MNALWTMYKGWIIGIVAVIIIGCFGCSALTGLATYGATRMNAQPVSVSTQVYTTEHVSPTEAPTEAPAEEAPAQSCAAYKIDFTDPDPQHPGHRIDAGSPNEREIVNLWQRGTKETTYVFTRMPVIRDFRISSFGNMWKFPQSCNFENLIERAVQYAKDTSPSNHTGYVYLVNTDGSLELITDDAFSFDLSTLPADPTK